ncbi:hypothetical protein AU184_03790 [Mycolicibacterium novocastrense]|uniref:hypothetical protein n=1 Tax=Mycolicibacterium novocastrense TaxID=59813 RepID=UPI000747604F|nr:hypothetical protein [Mycolicibacterium novocastrense]KUH70733.1 hypothetical protein AU183_18120 [Mycolicibacterium novocastrense]KUH71727.1 hypothetical protein AU072_11055 [Mycolicibacterium novocastrense]KUH72052.1 hypothetical protein AU184_03790 [Mycolicibacterium novocastrense]
MLKSDRNYPTAIAAGPEHGDRGLRDGLRWLMSMVDEVGGEPLIFAPGRANVDHNNLLSEFIRRTGVPVATWRSPARGWNGGPVLAVWPTREKLGEIAEDRRTRALCVVPWVKGEVDAWAAAAMPELLGPAVMPEHKSLDPVVVQGLKTLTQSVNMGNNLAGSLDHRDAVAVLRTLKDGGYRLLPDAIYSWAIANGWQTRGAERLRTLAAKFEAGTRVKLKGGYPFRSDILDIWRRNAEKA